MIEHEWPTYKQSVWALEFKSGLFKRRRLDGLVVCMDDMYILRMTPFMVPAEEDTTEGTQTPTFSLENRRRNH